MGMPETLQVSCVQLHWARSIEYNLDRTRYYIRRAAEEGSRVVLFPEANLTGYYFPYAVTLAPAVVQDLLEQAQRAARAAGIWVIVGSLRPTADRYLNLAHVIAPDGTIAHEYAKVHPAGRDEQQYCRGGNKVSLFLLDGIPCTLVICRDGRHPELYRLPAMAGARILMGLGLLACSFSKQPWQYMVCFAFVGIGSGAFWAPVTSMVRQWFIDKLGLAMGLTTAAAGAAMFLGPLISMLII